MMAIVTSHFNPCSFKRPISNLHWFNRWMQQQGLPLFIVDCSIIGKQPWVLPAVQRPNTTVIRTCSESILFHKERLLNLAIAKLPPEYDSVAWIDADIWFMNPNWYNLTQEALEKYQVVQPFDVCHWSNRDGSCNMTRSSTMRVRSVDPRRAHPGFAMAARRETLQKIGGLFDLGITGAGDLLMTSAWLNDDPINNSMFERMPEGPWREKWLAWVAQARNVIGDEAGVVSDSHIIHAWHGDVKDRNYINRYAILNDINPDLDLTTNPDGVWEWSDQASDDVKNKMTEYFVNRKED